MSSKNDPLDSWLSRWIHRYGIKLKSIHGESAECDVVRKREWLNGIFSDITRRYNPKDIFNADEAGLFIEQITRKSYCHAGEKPQGGKIGKRRVTILLAASMVGEKFRCVIISSQQYPTAVMQYDIRPYDYFAQQNQWMDLTTFEAILDLWNGRLKISGRKIALIVDGATVHRTEKTYSNISLFFLPPSQTAILQPLDQGVIRSFKSIYRTLLFDFTVEKRMKGGKGSFRLTTFIRMICRAWARVKTDTICNCFRSAGWIDNQSRQVKYVKLGLETSDPTPNTPREGSEPSYTEEEVQAVTYLQKNLHLLSHSGTAGDQQTQTSEDELGMELERENEYAVEPWERNEQTRVLYHLGLEVPSRPRQLPLRYADFVSDISDDDEETEPLDSIPNEFRAIRSYAKHLETGSRRDLILRMVSSIERDLKDQKNKQKKLIQSHISFKPYQTNQSEFN